jgi:hypothetical protein
MMMHIPSRAKSDVWMRIQHFNRRPIRQRQMIKKNKESDANKDIDRNLAFLDLTLKKIRRDDSFDKVSSDKNLRLSDDDAKYHLQEFEVKNNLAFIIVSLDGIQFKDGDIRLKHGEMRQKIEEILAIAKQLFNNNDIYR